MAESARARAWIWSLLANDATLSPLIGAGSAARIYHGVAPAGAALPYVIMQQLSAGNDLYVVGMARIWTDPLYLVKAVCKGSSTGPIEPIANRIDALLHKGSGTVTNGVIWTCKRERGHELPEVSDGVQYQNLGGEYRVTVTQV